MKHFNSFAAFGEFLISLVPVVEHAEHTGLEGAAHIIQAEAKRELGTYQDAAGPFAGWAKLKPSTLEGFEIGERHIPGKNELNYSPPDNPNLREGLVRDNIEATVEHHEASVGVPSKIVTHEYDPRPVDIGDVAKWLELGHAGPYRAPPRSFLGGAAVRKTDHAVDCVTGHIVHALAGSPEWRGPAEERPPPI